MTKEQFKNLRTALDMNQEQFALVLGYRSYQRVSEIENGKRPITSHVERLCNMLMAGVEQKRKTLSSQTGLNVDDQRDHQHHERQG